MSKAKEPWQGLMYRFEGDCGTPSCIGGHIESYYCDEITKIRKNSSYDFDEFISEKLKIPEVDVSYIIYPKFSFANCSSRVTEEGGHITKPMVVKFLKNLLKEEDPAACWWLASEGVVL